MKPPSRRKSIAKPTEAEMFRWLEKRARQTNFDGGWSGYWDIRGIPAHSGSTFAGAKPFDHKTFRNAVQVAMKAESGEKK